jgi:hypothetical protein
MLKLFPQNPVFSGMGLAKGVLREIPAYFYEVGK